MSALGWPRAGWMLAGALTAGMLVLAGATLAIYGIDDSTLGVVARNAARSSLILFSLAFSAGPLERFFPAAPTRWLFRHRPFIGVSFVVSHLIFLASHVVRAFVVHDGDFFALRPPFAWIGGGTLYVVMIAMAVTSFPGPAARIGPRAWKLLHTVGSYAIFATFLNSYGYRVLFVPLPEYLPALGLLLGVLVLRAAAFAHRRFPPCRAMLNACLRGSGG